MTTDGHGNNTFGKCSPDNKLREYAWAREEIAVRLVDKLKTIGYDARRLTPEKYDVSITKRVLRANEICKNEDSRTKCKKYGVQNVLQHIRLLIKMFFVILRIDFTPCVFRERKRGGR